MSFKNITEKSENCFSKIKEKFRFRIIFSMMILFSLSIYSQNTNITDFDRGFKIGEILVNGLSVLKGGKASFSNGNFSTKSQFCVKNKLPEKIQFKLEGIVKKEDEETTIKKELVIPTGGKECLFELDKQIWNYEIILTTKKETHKKGELKVDDDVTITVNE